MATFNGHRSWNAWDVSLWINNDEGLYRLAQQALKATSSKDAAAKRLLESLASCGITKTPDGARYSVSSIRAAMVGM